MPHANIRRRMSVTPRSVFRSLIGFFALVIAGSAFCVPAQAAPPTTPHTGVHGVTRSTPVENGTDGTVPWVLDSDGVLTFGAGTFAELSDSSARNWKNGRASVITSIVFADPTNTVFPVNSSYFFERLTAVTTMDGIAHVDTSLVTNMNTMFTNMPALTELDLSSFDTSSVTDMTFMFNSLPALTELDISSFDTSSVTNMFAMFAGTFALTELDVSSFDTSSVTNMSAMFAYMYALTELDLSSFDTSSVTDMSNMFAHTIQLERLTLGVNSAVNLTTGLPFVTWTLLSLPVPLWTGTTTDLIVRSQSVDGPGTYARNLALTIQFDGAEPSVVDVPSSISGTTIDTLTIPTTVPSRTGYTFTGWNTASDGSGTSYAAGDTAYFMSGINTLYAQWQVISSGTVTVKYQDTTGKQLQPDTSLTDFVGEQYVVPTP